MPRDDDRKQLSTLVVRPVRRQLPWETICLVLQGGGALGSYQAGVYEGLDEAGIEPDWVAGISIGALNSAIIAGNPPEMRVRRLRDFWNRICRPAVSLPTTEVIHAAIEPLGGEVRRLFSAFEAWRAVSEGQAGFFAPRFPPFAALGMRVGTAGASYYDTSALKATLEAHADFDRINDGPMRVSVGAVNVRTGNFAYFDNRRTRLRPEHFMASGALPPAFPAVEIDGEYYWDGGLVSNTPLSEVLGARPRRDTLAFQVDLWSAIGVLPDSVFDVQERVKDIQYSSRTRMVTNLFANEQHYRRILREVIERLPEGSCDNDAWCRQARELACGKRYGVIHLIYQGKEWEGLSKDYEFGPLTMRDHWQSGLDDIRASLAHDDWLQLPPEGQEFVAHDFRRA
ncbi:DUF3734 domain-containing protein [Derxia gummosa]|uniref:DUF3734 domain-containing protein n=1 Tax=Derxia gummosa DSM 723 TaxID=1121388 RepID=A0A8B6X3H7_9BURK|nr:patatin-like phospholipase family protein [Derxia gummosa]